MLEHLESDWSSEKKIITQQSKAMRSKIKQNEWTQIIVFILNGRFKQTHTWMTPLHPNEVNNSTAKVAGLARITERISLPFAGIYHTNTNEYAYNLLRWMCTANRFSNGNQLKFIFHFDLICCVCHRWIRKLIFARFAPLKDDNFIKWRMNFKVTCQRKLR